MSPIYRGRTCKASRSPAWGIDIGNRALKAIKLPAKLEPDATYGAGVVEGAKEPKPAADFVDGLVDGECAEALQAAGFGAPPG